MALAAAHTNPTTGARLSKAYIAVRKIELQFSDAAADPDGVVVHVGVWANQKARAQGLAPAAQHVLYTTVARLSPFARVKDGADLRGAVYRFLTARKAPLGDGLPDLRKALKA